MNLLLRPVETDILFSRKDILPFRFFWKVLLQLQGGQYILKNIITARGNRFLQHFSDTDSNGFKVKESQLIRQIHVIF